MKKNTLLTKHLSEEDIYLFIYFFFFLGGGGDSKCSERDQTWNSKNSE